jgi:hypothetical protein
MFITDPHLGMLKRVETETQERLKLEAPQWSSRGILMCAGGKKLIPQLLVALNYLTLIGNKLPVEVFYGDPEEFPEEIRQRFSENWPTVKFVCIQDPFRANEINFKGYRDMNFRGFQIKPIALWCCSFEEVLYLDCDVLLKNMPETYFEEENYKRTGSLFFPDFWRYDMFDRRRSSPQVVQGGLLNTLYKVQTDRTTYEVESGVFVFHKTKLRKTLEALQVITCNYPYFYNIIYGDKDTFRLAAGVVGESIQVVKASAAIFGYKDGDMICGDGMTQFIPSGDNTVRVSHHHLTVNAFGERRFNYKPALFIPYEDATIQIGLIQRQTELTPLNTATVTLQGECRQIELSEEDERLLSALDGICQSFISSDLFKKYYSK